MDSRNSVIKTIHFDDPDKLPTDMWIISAAYKKYGKFLYEILEKNPIDFARIENQLVSNENNHIFEAGSYTDSWGCVWNNVHDGVFGQVRKSPLNDIDLINKYKAPLIHARAGWENIDKQIKNAEDKFIICSQINPFERMQFIRGTENLFMDLAYGSKEVYLLRDIVWEYFDKMINKWLKYQRIDAVAFTDDWGNQQALLISPNLWREFFKPMYESMISNIKKEGKYVFFHSDGYILDIYKDMIELKIDAINSQIWCMDISKIAEQFAGKITFWGELSRQTTLPFGNPEEIRKSAEIMIKNLYTGKGGLIGQCEIGPDVPLDNIKAATTCWDIKK